MPSCVKIVRTCLILLSLGSSSLAWSEDFGVNVLHANLIENEAGYYFDAEIDYQLSPVAKEALEKGVALTWNIRLEIRQTGFLWTRTLFKKKIRQSLQYHALLKQYEVRSPDHPPEMFLTLNAALNFMSFPRLEEPIPPSLVSKGQRYLLAVRSRFDHESLPVPLRPFTYINREWFLSSPWFLWPIQK